MGTAGEVEMRTALAVELRARSKCGPRERSIDRRPAL